ncbi:MAG: hypothetical protein B7Z53_01655, partial [Rhodospirillales bacterium 12-71-4]
ALREAARQAAAWRRGGTGRPPYIAVNLSGRQLEGQDIPALFRDTLQQEDLPPEALVAELTETVAFGRGAAAMVGALRALGVRVALDDFGAGFSSLGILGSLQVDTVKLDRALLAHVATDARERRLLTGLAGTIHALGLHIVAEGLETEAQFAVARDAGCDAAQGWLLGRALPADAATALVVGRG